MSFDGSTFIRHVAQRLVQEFEFSAGAGTPGLVGAAKEHPARIQLEKLMPEGIAVGSGIIVDSYGGISKQQDIVIYERVCPVFTHNGTAEATYFPVEGVISAGEVKSTLSKHALEDAFAKSQSVKKLRRHAVPDCDSLGYTAVSYRTYGQVNLFAATRENEFDQENKALHQVHTFILCEKFESSPSTVLKNAAESYRNVGVSNGPNFIASLKDGFIAPHDSRANSMTFSAMEADGMMFCGKSDDAFGQLLRLIRIYIQTGKTVDRNHYERYFRPIGEVDPRFTIDDRVSL